jgi:hypothetical protein
MLVLPDAFGPTISVNGASRIVASRRARKFLKVTVSTMPFIITRQTREGKLPLPEPGHRLGSLGLRVLTAPYGS